MKPFSFVPRQVRNPQNIWRWIVRYYLTNCQRIQLANSNFSILSNNCLGGLITHDLLQPQLSPFVNLFMYPHDYLRFLTTFEESLSSKLKHISSDKPYPVGEVNGCIIHFMHYHTFEDAERKWYQRIERINRSKMLVIMVERDGCTLEMLKQFDLLPFKHKIVLVHKPYPEIHSAVVIKGFEHKGEVGMVTDWTRSYGGQNIRRYRLGWAY